MSPSAINSDTSKASTRCQHYEVCGRVEHAEGLGYCILHDPDMEKDRVAFDAALAEHRAMLEERREEAKHKEGDDYEPQWGLRDDFRWMVFPDEMSFAGEMFPDEGVSFSRATFGNRVSFFRACFSNNAEFWEATFGSGANFWGATFGNWAGFEKSAFGDYPGFEKARFGMGTRFGMASFGNMARFTGAVFDDGACFTRATFGNRAQFAGVTFGKKPSFVGAKLGEWTNFAGAVFGDLADFSASSFGNCTSFASARFGNETEFRWTTFGDRTDFRKSIHGDRVVFLACTYGKTVSYAEAEFIGAASFKSSDHQSLFSLPKSTTEVNFEEAIFHAPSRVIFRNVDLSRTQLLHVDAREVEFTNVTWPQIEGGKGVYDEIVAERFRDAVPYAALARLYRRLKQNYEDNRDYGRGGDFHYREKEMLRLNSKTRLGQRVLLTLYRVVSGYGERYWAAGWFLGLVVVCSLLSLVLGLEYTAAEEMQWTLRWRPDDFCRSLVYGVQTAFVRPPNYMVPANLWGEVVKVITMILGPLFLGLFALAVRQRVRR